ncbi:hypothetical protein H4Q32_027662 [Labeo rohita]|uniref:Uncharacterized protein n=1 Tax=Labeo rohita TaxID=84645 RepID=A0ABQ8L1Z9_LABRO|nr:hypothetical protein H4Q32_027661 [Labeo rohita]KAI2643106.1 hypothetical protein H4Q32_027662 [Labeo rohita]
MADISSLLDEHRAALSADFKSSFESLASTLESIHSTITDHGQRIDSLETNAISADEHVQHLEDVCFALLKDNESLRLKVADLEGCSRHQNVQIIGLPELIESPCPTVFYSQLLVKIFGTEILASPPKLDKAHRSLAPKLSLGENPWFHRFQVKDLIICEAHKRGSLLYKGHTIRLHTEYRGPMAVLYKPGRRHGSCPLQRRFNLSRT